MAGCFFCGLARTVASACFSMFGLTLLPRILRRTPSRLGLCALQPRSEMCDFCLNGSMPEARRWTHLFLGQLGAERAKLSWRGQIMSTKSQADVERSLDIQELSPPAVGRESSYASVYRLPNDTPIEQGCIGALTLNAASNNDWNEPDSSGWRSIDIALAPWGCSCSWTVSMRSSY